MQINAAENKNFHLDLDLLDDYGIDSTVIFESEFISDEAGELIMDKLAAKIEDGLNILRDYHIFVDFDDYGPGLDSMQKAENAEIYEIIPDFKDHLDRVFSKISYYFLDELAEIEIAKVVHKLAHESAVEIKDFYNESMDVIKTSIKMTKAEKPEFNLDDSDFTRMQLSLIKKVYPADELFESIDLFCADYDGKISTFLKSDRNAEDYIVIDEYSISELFDSFVLNKSNEFHLSSVISEDIVAMTDADAELFSGVADDELILILPQAQIEVNFRGNYIILEDKDGNNILNQTIVQGLRMNAVRNFLKNKLALLGE